MAEPASALPIAAIVTVSATFVLWGLTKVYESYSKFSEKNSERKKYLIALYAEVDFNTKDMELFISESASVEAVVEKVKSDLKFIPHITDARHKEIYKQNLSDITNIGSAEIGKLVYFYGLLEKLQNQVEGIYLPSFVLISSGGREATIREIVATASSCAITGRELLSRLENDYPDYRLVRNPRTVSPSSLSGTQLDKRFKKLDLDLDGVNATHRKSPSN